MEPKRTKKTAKLGEIKPTNNILLRQMVSVSNNSILTNRTANMLSQKLDKKEMNDLLDWFYHANREAMSVMRKTQGRRF